MLICSNWFMYKQGQQQQIDLVDQGIPGSLNCDHQINLPNTEAYWKKLHMDLQLYWDHQISKIYVD